MEVSQLCQATLAYKKSLSLVPKSQHAKSFFLKNKKSAHKRDEQSKTIFKGQVTKWKAPQNDNVTIRKAPQNDKVTNGGAP